MSKVKSTLTAKEYATSLEELATRIEAGDRSADLQVLIARATETAMAMEDLDVIIALNRLGLVLQPEAGPHRYPIVEKAMKELTPLDPTGDAAGLRRLATEIRKR
jgi:hypothetical protein